MKVQRAVGYMSKSSKCARFIISFIRKGLPTDDICISLSTLLIYNHTYILWV